MKGLVRKQLGNPMENKSKTKDSTDDPLRRGPLIETGPLDGDGVLAETMKTKPNPGNTNQTNSQKHEQHPEN